MKKEEKIVGPVKKKITICLVVEGCYPYVVGGVSSWVQMLIKQTDYADFIIQTLVSDRSKSGKFVIELPKNVREVREIYLSDCDWVGEKKKSRLRLNSTQYAALRSLLLGENIDWPAVYNMFADETFSINDLLMGGDFMRVVREFYTLKYPNVIFSDFLWSMRSMYLPLFYVLKNSPPEADIYHCVATGYAGVWGSMAKHKYNSPLLISEHGIYTREREEELIKATWVKGIYKDIWIGQFYKMSGCAYANADKVTSLFENARKLQIELGCPENKTVVTPNGINVDSFEGIKMKADDDKYINVGAILRIAPIKDVKTMLSAYYYAKQKEPMLKLWIMGHVDKNDEYTKECLSLVDNMGIEDVVFTGMINVKDYVGTMDILILTSISEGQPMIILEGFSAKKPCIATNVGNCEGLIYGESDDFGDAGIVVPVMDVVAVSEAIVKLASDEKLRTQMGLVGYKRVTTKYAEQMLRSTYDNLYDEVLEPYDVIIDRDKPDESDDKK